MPSETQLIELGKLVRESRIWFDIHRDHDRVVLGKAISLAQTMLVRWAERAVVDRLGQDRSEAQDLLNEAAERIIVGFATVNALTGKEFYLFMKKIVEHLISDQERRRFAIRRRGGEALSLERDANAARLAELLADEQPGPEAIAMSFELIGEVRRAMQGLAPDERRAVRLMMDGKTLAWVVERFGIETRAAWRRARVRLREALAAEGAYAAAPM